MSPVPSAQLKSEQTGVIFWVDFYSDYDYFREDPKEEQWKRIKFSIPLGEGAADHFFNDISKTIPKTLEECTQEHLELLSSIELTGNQRLLLEELKQIQSLERELRNTVGDYRKR